MPTAAGRPDQKTDTTRPIDAGAAQVQPRQAPAPAAAPRPAPAASPAPAKGAGIASPAAAKILAEKGTAPRAVQGTGRDGRITKADAVTAVPTFEPQTPAPPTTARVPSPPADEAREERVRMSRLRQTIARRLKDAQNTAAMLTTFNEADMTVVMALRNQYTRVFEKKHGVKPGFMGFFVKAACRR